MTTDHFRVAIEELEARMSGTPMNLGMAIRQGVNKVLNHHEPMLLPDSVEIHVRQSLARNFLASILAGESVEQLWKRIYGSQIRAQSTRSLEGGPVETTPLSNKSGALEDLEDEHAIWGSGDRKEAV
jgi:hypothetical protein